MDNWYALMLGHEHRHRELERQAERERLVDSLSADRRTTATSWVPSFLVVLTLVLTVVLLRAA